MSPEMSDWKDIVFALFYVMGLCQGFIIGGIVVQTAYRWEFRWMDRLDRFLKRHSSFTQRS